MTVGLLHPQAVWLLPLVGAVWWTARGRLPGWQVALRGAAFACIVLALAQPGVTWRTAGGWHAFVIDGTPRLAPAIRAQAERALAARLARVPAGDRVVLVEFGGAPIAARADRRIRLDGASLSAALAEAARAIPLGAAGSVTLITDGLSSDRHWGASVDALVRRGIPVDTVRLPTSEGPAFVSAVDAARVRAGETMPVTVTVEGRGRDLRVDLYADGRPVAASAPVAVDGIAAVPLSFTAPGSGFHRLRAVAAGTAFDTVVAVQPPLRLLYLAPPPAGGGAALQRLLGPGFAVEARDPATLGAGVDPGTYRAVMIDDVPAARIAPAFQRRLVDAVATRGVGLLHAGGDAAFGGGGWDRTPLAAALPLTLRQDERVRKPSVALAVVIDSSGSMGGDPLDLAKQIAVLAARKLGPQDSIGVVEFYGAKQWAVPMQPVRDHLAVERAIGRMQAQGSSVLFPAIQEAYYGIKDVDARFRHILVISDGDVSDGTFEQLLRHVSAQGITVSTAVIGGNDAGVRRMMDWARWGRGRSYVVNDDTGLVQIDLSPPQTAPDPAYRSAATGVRVAADRGWWRDPAIGAVPPVTGHVRVGARPGAETLLATADGDPLLTSWQFGAGRVTALMTQPLGSGSRGWAAWPRYGEWLGRTIAATADPATALAATLTRRFDTIELTVQRAGADGPPPVATLAGGQRLPLAAMAPGVFVGTAAWPSARDALVRVDDGRDQALAADRAGSDVMRGRLSRRGALPLADLSRLTGGTSIDAGRAGAGTAVSGGDVAYRALGAWLALAALTLYLIEITCRRWPRRRVGQRLAAA